MTSQITDKFILDATAGFRMMWFNKTHPNCIYLDERAECEPDIIGDFRDLKQFEDNKFRVIVFDPPHIIKSNGICNQNTLREFGYLQSETWQSDLKQAFSELWRVLAPYGVLLFKWNNCSSSSVEVLKLIPHKPLFYNVSAQKQKKISEKSSTRKLRTMWFCFMKIPEGNK
jgi:SAM-dependent methyltransferase